MTLAHWFSYYCPYFSGPQLELFLNSENEQIITAVALNRCGLVRAANWLVKNEQNWLEFVRSIPQRQESILNGGVHVLPWGHDLYPQRLRNINHPPGICFTKGNAEILSQPCIAVVGARHPTELGKLWVREVMAELVKGGITVVSGGARGIDAEAHWSTLLAGGRTCAVLPGSVEKPYPMGNKYIFDEVVRDGLLLSEFPPGECVHAGNFFRRNRLIAGLADAVVVVEAARKSGTMLTALHARDENIDLLVVPGPAMVASYAGSLDLLMDGAFWARDHRDVLNVLAKKKCFEKSAGIT